MGADASLTSLASLNGSIKMVLKVDNVNLCGGLKKKQAGEKRNGPRDCRFLDTHAGAGSSSSSPDHASPYPCVSSPSR